MKLSRYTLFVSNYPVTGKHVAYNTRTQGLITISDALHEKLKKLPFDTSREDPESQAVLNKLQSMGITAPDEADELDIVRDWFEKIRYNSKELEAYILTTYFCNFACPYCFEGKVKEQKKYMSKEKADEAIRWLKHKALEVNPEKVKIVFYGGEPLMNAEILEYIAKELHDWLATTPWKFSFSMITNGALVTEDLVDRLNPLGLEHIRITLDGDKEEHDKYRPYIGGRGTFDVIMRNIVAVADKTKVVLAGNFNANNYESLYQLMDRLEDLGLRQKIAMIDFKPITERRDPVDKNSETASTFACDPGHGDKMVILKRELMRRGFKTSRSLEGGGICHFKAASHQVIIDTDGYIFKCPAMVGHYDKTVGNVADEKFTERYDDFMGFDLADYKGKCGTCEYLPFCAGGCNYHAELETGSYKNVFCEKEFFDKTIDDFIKMKYDQLVHKKKQEAAKSSVVK